MKRVALVIFARGGFSCRFHSELIVGSAQYDPDDKIKFFAAESLRGVGGRVFEANGNRFVKDLGRRNYVTCEVWKSKYPFRFALNKAPSEVYESGAALSRIWKCLPRRWRTRLKLVIRLP